MTVRNIQWIADSGLLVGLTTIGEFAAPPVLTPLSLSISQFTLGVPASGAILSAMPGSTILAAGAPAGFTISIAGWSYNGSGVAGTYSFTLTETLIGSANSPSSTSITVSVVPPNADLDFSQPDNSGEVAAIRSF